jgi:hypothetical protein
MLVVCHVHMLFMLSLSIMSFDNNQSLIEGHATDELTPTVCSSNRRSLHVVAR